jgi:uncharacterized oxidoreductase
MSAEAGRITADRLTEAARLILAKAGADGDIAMEVAENLVDAEASGHASHGLRLLALYMERLVSGGISGTARPRILSVDGPIVRIEGEGAFGQVVGTFAARHGIAQAKQHGIAAVTVSNSGHFGRNGRWPELATERGVASLHFINAPGAASSVAPPGGSQARLTSNPVAFGAPRRGGAPVIVDFATGDFSVNAVKLVQERGEKLPRASILQEDGTLTDDPAAFFASRAMLPFGGFKGFGLAVFVEILAGALTGGHCHKGDGQAGPANNMLSLYLDVARLADIGTYEREVEAFLTWLGSGEGQGQAVIPGTRSRMAREKARQSGLAIHPALRQLLLATAAKLSVADEITAMLQPD